MLYYSYIKYIGVYLVNRQGWPHIPKSPPHILFLTYTPTFQVQFVTYAVNMIYILYHIYIDILVFHII